MSFDAQLQAEQRPEWRSNYINYTRLKKYLRNVMVRTGCTCLFCSISPSGCHDTSFALID
jgi:hypothetical protein